MTKSNKPIAIYQDQRIAEEWCNFRCEYCEGFCPTEYSLRKDENGNLHVAEEWYDKIEKMPESVKKFFANGRGFKEFYDVATAVMNESKKVMDTDILKISGGELTVNPNLCNYVETLHNQYKMVQILSNGSNIKSEEIERYKRMGNVTFQISLDGVTAEANYSKSHSSFMTKKVVETIGELLNNGIGVEVNCVLTKYNTDKFKEFLEHFKNAKNLMIVPRPVRGEPRSILDFNEQQILEFERCIIDNYNKYNNILPPLTYFERLINIMKTGKRSYKCYIPYFIQSIDGYGKFEMCPIGLQYKDNSNVISGDINSNHILINSEYKPNNNYQLCDYCIIQYEMLNLYVDGIISEDELKKMPSLNNNDIIMHIKHIKHGIMDMESVMDNNERGNKEKVLSRNR